MTEILPYSTILMVEDSQVGPLALALGIGAIFGIVIGSKTTFHSPVRRRVR